MIGRRSLSQSNREHTSPSMSHDIPVPAPMVRCRPAEGKSSNPTKRAKLASLPDSSVKSLDLIAASPAPTSATSDASKTSGATLQDLGANVLAAVVSGC